MNKEREIGKIHAILQQEPGGDWCKSQAIYEANYRQVPEGSVVLSKEEYEKYQALKRDVEHSFEYNQGFVDGEDKGTKKTSAEIFLTAEAFYKFYADKDVAFKELMEHIKKYGVEATIGRK